MSTNEAMLSRLIDLTAIGDERGWLVSLEGEMNVPFAIKRVYYIYGTQPHIRRGLHAHRDLEQLVVCLSGQCTFLLDDGYRREEILLDNPARALYIGSMVWREMHDFTPDCVLMVLASRHYDTKDYIRSYQEFGELAHAKEND